MGDSVISILNRTNNARFKLHVRGDISVLRMGHVKRLLENPAKIPVQDQVILYRGVEVLDSQTGGEIDLTNGSSIEVDARPAHTQAPSLPRSSQALAAPGATAPSITPAAASQAPPTYEDGLRFSYHAERDAYQRELEELGAHQERLRRVITSGEQKLTSLQEEVQRVHAELENARLEESFTARQQEEVKARKAALDGEIQKRREEEQGQLLAEQHRQEAILANIDSRRRDLSWRHAEIDKVRREQELSITAAERELEALEAQVIDESRETNRRQVALSAIGPVNPHGVPPREAAPGSA